MTTPPDANQILRVPGEIQIIPSSTFADAKGVLSFMGNFGTRIGQLRTYGYGAFQSMLLDSAECYGGTQFRSSTSQGDSTIGGQSAQMSIAIDTGGTTTMKRVIAKENSTAYQQSFTGAANLQVGRANTSGTTNLVNAVASFTQDSWKDGETMQIINGMSQYGGASVWAYTANSTSSSDVLNTAYLGMIRSGSLKKNILLLTSGDVEIPTKLKADTLEALHWIGLPPLNPTDLLPITLDKVNNRVGINNANPVADLDVNGKLLATTVEATNWIGLPVMPPPDILPITLDKVNNMVGINQTVPAHALDVTGSVNSTGTFNLRGNVFVASNDLCQSVRVGLNAGAETQTNFAVAVGNGAGRYTQGSAAVAVGTSAGTTTQKDRAIAIGNLAGNASQGIGAVSIGYQAGQTTQADRAVAIGSAAGNDTQNTQAVAIGYQAGQTTQGSNTVAIGVGAGKTSQQDNSVAIANAAGTTNQGTSCVAIGLQAGNDTQASYSVAIGHQAGMTKQTGGSGVAIGTFAGSNTQQGTAVAIGYYAATNLQGNSAISIGQQCGTAGQAANAIAIGSVAGQTSQKGSAVAIGISAGNNTQGSNAVAVGAGAGNANQGDFSVAIGSSAGNSGQLDNAVAIGYGAGQTTQSQQTVAIGQNAGKTSQGRYAIAIGTFAGQTSQHSNTIILNASGATLESTQVSSTFIKPVRQALGTGIANYNSTTSELTCQPISIMALTSTQALTFNDTATPITFNTINTALDSGTATGQNIANAFVGITLIGTSGPLFRNATTANVKATFTLCVEVGDIGSKVVRVVGEILTSATGTVVQTFHDDRHFGVTNTADKLSITTAFAVVLKPDFCFRMSIKNGLADTSTSNIGPRSILVC